MSKIKNETNSLLAMIRQGKPMTGRQQLWLTVQLSVPAIVAQLSSILMQYIDASMVGSLGANASASIGLVSTTTWLFWGVCSAAATGFSVQVAHLIGAGDMERARAVLRQSIVSVFVFSLLLGLAGVAISGSLPPLAGRRSGYTARFFSVLSHFFRFFLPMLQLNFLAGGMLRCSGNMRIPSMLNILMCVLDVIFNFFLIFPTRDVELFGSTFRMPGAGLGVEGAALGTVFAEVVVAALMMGYLVTRSPELKLTGEKGRFIPRRAVLKQAAHISLPMGLEHVVICGAQIMTTVIVARSALLPLQPIRLPSLPKVFAICRATVFRMRLQPWWGRVWLPEEGS